MILSGLENTADIEVIFESLFGSNAEYNAETAELLEVVRAWPSLSSVTRAKVLKLVGKDRP